jgi:hypothetical protein
MGSISYSNSFSNVTYTDFVLRTVDNTQKLVIGTGASLDSNACIYIVNNKLGFYKPPELGYVLDCINGLRVDDSSNVYIPTSLHVQSANISNLEIPNDGSFITKHGAIQNVIGLNNEVHIGNIATVSNIYIGGSNTTFQNIHIGGSSNGSTLNIGLTSNDIINLNGQGINFNTQNINFKNKTIIVNSQNSNSSGSLCGLQILESNNVNGYIVTSTDRTSWLFKTPLGSEWTVNLANSNVAFNGNRIVLSSNNNVGIGTSTPDTLLTVGGDVKINNNMTVQNTLQTNTLNVSNSATFSQLNVTSMTGTNASITSLQPNVVLFQNGFDLNGRMILNKIAENDHQISAIGYSNNLFKFQLDNANNSFVFATAQNDSASQELLRIRGNGNIGIGTSNPIEKLDINGSISVNNFVYSSFLRPNKTSNLSIDPGTLNGWTFINSVNSNGGIGLLGKHIMTSNVVGLGTTTPQYLLDVNGTGNFVNTRCSMSNSVFNINPLLDIYDKSTLIGEHIFYNERFNRFVAMTDGLNAGFGAIVPMMGNVRFYTGNFPGETTNMEIPANSFSNLERMVIGENVGIGTSNPPTKLTVAGTGRDISIRNSSQSNFTQSFELQDDTGNIWSITRPSNTNILKIGNSTIDHLFFIDNGNVGVGSAFVSKSTEALMHVYDNSNMNDVLSVGNPLGSVRFTNTGKLAAYNFNGIKYFEATNNLSDKRLKTNITPLKNSLEKLTKLNGVSFKYNQDLGLGSNTHLGCIAQDVEKYIPEVVEKDETTDYYRMHYDKLVPILIESIKELHQEIKILKEKLDQ